MNETVDAELAELPADRRARLVRIAELTEQVGLPKYENRTCAASAGSSGRYA
jgi:hypothetical protein